MHVNETSNGYYYELEKGIHLNKMNVVFVLFFLNYINIYYKLSLLWFNN